MLASLNTRLEELTININMFKEGRKVYMSESINEIKINNDDTYLIVKQIIKLLYLVIEDNKRIQSELFLLIDNYPNFSVNV